MERSPNRASQHGNLRKTARIEDQRCARVYLDNNATTPLLPEVFEAMRPYFFEKFGNASSIHQQGQQARAAVEHAREQVAELLNCRAAGDRLHQRRHRGRQPGAVRPGEAGRSRHHFGGRASRGAERLQAPGRDGLQRYVLAGGWAALVDPDDVRRALRPETKLISIILANNETGVLQPVRRDRQDRGGS